MNHMSTIRLHSYSLLFLIFPLNALSQSDKTASVLLTDTIKSVTESSRHSLYTGLGYGSNMIYLGSTISCNQPFEYSSLVYGFNNELFISISTFHLANLDPYLAFYNFSLNYSHVFNSWFDLSAGVYRYQVNSSLADTLFSNFTYGDITLGIDWKLIYSKISFGGIISKEPQTYFQIKNSRYFQTPEFFNDKAFISFDPYVNLLFGTMLKTETSVGTSIITTTQQYNIPWSSGANNIGNTSAGNGTGSSEGSGSSSSTTTTTSTTTNTVPTAITSYTKTFDLIEIEFGLPVAFNLNFMTIEAEAGYVLPAYSNQDFPGPKGFIFMLSGFFKIF